MPIPNCYSLFFFSFIDSTPIVLPPNCKHKPWEWRWSTPPRMASILCALPFPASSACPQGWYGPRPRALHVCAAPPKADSRVPMGASKAKRCELKAIDFNLRRATEKRKIDVRLYSINTTLACLRVWLLKASSWALRAASFSRSSRSSCACRAAASARWRSISSWKKWYE